MFFRHRSLSRTSVLACVESIIARLQRHCRHGCQLRQIRINPSLLDLDDNTVRTFSAAHGITFVPYTQPPEPSYYPSFLLPLFANANPLSSSDTRALCSHDFAYFQHPHAVPILHHPCLSCFWS